MTCGVSWGDTGAEERWRLWSKPRLKGCFDLSYKLGFWVPFYLEIKESFKKLNWSRLDQALCCSPAFLPSWKTSPFPSWPLRCNSNVTYFKMPSWFPQAPCCVFPELFITVPEIAYFTQYYKLYGAVSPQSTNSCVLFISLFLVPGIMLRA